MRRAQTIVLTNAAGALNADVSRAAIVMLIRDHINSDRRESPIGRQRREIRSSTWSMPTRLGIRALRARATLRDVRAPRRHLRWRARARSMRRPAEREALRRIGADAVGMSTVLETIAARALGLEVLGISLITNVASPTTEVSHEDVLAASQDGAERVAQLIESVLGAL